VDLLACLKNHPSLVASQPLTSHATLHAQKVPLLDQISSSPLAIPILPPAQDSTVSARHQQAFRIKVSAIMKSV
jgi:hypothetical protein